MKKNKDAYVGEAEGIIVSRIGDDISIEAWKPTMNLAFFDVTTELLSETSDTEMDKHTRTMLHQQWISDKGKVEWKPVPYNGHINATK